MFKFHPLTYRHISNTILVRSGFDHEALKLKVNVYWSTLPCSGRLKRHQMTYIIVTKKHEFLAGTMYYQFDMLTPLVCPPRPSTECSRAVMEGLCQPDLNRGIGTVVNDVGGTYNEVQALTWPHICHGQRTRRPQRGSKLPCHQILVTASQMWQAVTKRW